MIRTPHPGRRCVAVVATLSSAAALAMVAGGAPSASAGSYEPSVCQSSDTRFFLDNVDGKVQMSARYWNGSRTEPVVEVNPSTVRWNVHRSAKHVIVRATDGLVALGGVKHVADPDGGLGEDTSITWGGVIKLRFPARGSGYMLCGDDPARSGAPWGY